MDDDAMSELESLVSYVEDANPLLLNKPRKEKNLHKHHHPLTPIDTPRSESELSFDFNYPTDDDSDWEKEDAPDPLTKVAMGTIYVPTKHFKPKPKYKRPEWYQMCKPNPSPTRLPKDHPSYDEEERRNLDNMIYILSIQVDGAEIKRKEEYEKLINVNNKNNSNNTTQELVAIENNNNNNNNNTNPETNNNNNNTNNNNTNVQHEIWIERENELRWDLCSALYRQSMYLRNHKKNTETEQSQDLMLKCTDNLRKILKLNPSHPSAKMLYNRCIDRLPHKSRTYLYGPSYTTDWIFFANPKSWRIPFYNHKVPRSKLYDPMYRELASHEAPLFAFWHYMDLKEGEGISDARIRANKNALIIQKQYRVRHKYRSKHIIILQRLYRGHAIRLAVHRKRKRESIAQSKIAKRARGMIWREHLKLMKISIVKMQCMVRRRIAMWKLYDLKLDKEHGLAAIEIQKMMRGWWRRRCWKLAKLRIRVLRYVVKLGCFMNRITKKRNAGIIIQKYYRCFVWARKWRIHKETKASTKVQKVFRVIRARRNYKKYYKSILLLQAAMRRKESKKEVTQMVIERTEDEVERVENEQEFIEYVEENTLDTIDEFLTTKNGKVIINSVAKRLANQQRQYRKKRFWLWWWGASKFKLRKARFASIFSNYDIMRTGRLDRATFRKFIEEELCIPMVPEEFEELSLIMDDSIPHGFRKNLSPYFYVTFETVYAWYATLNGWPITETNEKRDKFAKSSISLASMNKEVYARAKRKLANSKFLKTMTSNKYKDIAKKTIMGQSKRHARRSAISRYRAVYKPCAVCKHCQRAFAFQSDLYNHRDGRIARTKGIFRLVLDAHRVKDEKSEMVKRWRISCVERQVYDQSYLERTHESTREKRRSRRKKKKWKKGRGISSNLLKARQNHRSARTLNIPEGAVDNAKDKKPSLASKKLLKMRQTLAKRKVKVGKTANEKEYVVIDKEKKDNEGGGDEANDVEKDDAKNEEANKIAKQEDEEIEEVNNGNVKVDEEVLDLVDDDEVDDASVDDDGNLQL